MDAEQVAWPSSFAARLGSWRTFAAGFPLITGLVLTMSGNWLSFVIWLPVLGVLVGWADRNRQRPALLLDAEGIRTVAGRLLLRWDDTALIWLGSNESPGRLRGLILVAWDAAALDFARRTGFVATPRLSATRIATRLPLAEAVAGIERFHSGVVRTAEEISLRHLGEELRRPADVE